MSVKLSAEGVTSAKFSCKGVNIEAVIKWCRKGFTSAKFSCKGVNATHTNSAGKCSENVSGVKRVKVTVISSSISSAVSSAL